ncbi:MAG: potassium channel family protein [Thermoguttaceae bacterium]|jgi:voltage-gated potassium channel|nr:potassium channel family protein [Thermoguttaceae bacterium]
MPWHRRTWQIVELARPGDTVSRAFDVAILSLIFLNVLAVVLGSVAAVQARFGLVLEVFEVVSVVVFTVEYAARLWSCTVTPRFAHWVTGRMRYALRPMMVIDLLAILPFYLPLCTIDLRSLRVLRLLRIVRVVKIGRYYSSLDLIKQVFQSKKEELVLTSCLMGLLLVVSSSVLYYCEHETQPEVFSSIPATMWWAVATLTTVGYGDMYPVTVAGRLCAGIIAVLGIGMFALPTGILGAGFVEAIQKSKQPHETCPHCGKELP